MTVPDAAAVLPALELRPGPAPLKRLLGDIWRSRALIVILARKEFYVRYRRASFGLIWALLLPLSQAVVLAFVLSRVADIETAVSYTLFIFSGTLVWGFFSSALTTAATSIVDGSGLSTKIYFPRAVLPVVSVAANFYGFLLSIALLLVMLPLYGVPVRPRLLLLVPAVALAVALTTSLALVLSAVHVYARDVRFLLEAVQRAWFYVTPIFYPLDRFADYRSWLSANPATGMVELFRAATIGADRDWLLSLWWSIGWVAGLTLLGLWLHRRRDRVFVDLM